MRKERTSDPAMGRPSFTTGEIARKYRTTTDQVRQWIDDGDLVAVRRKNFIRIRPEALDQFEARFTIGSPDAIAALIDLRERAERRINDERGAS